MPRVKKGGPYGYKVWAPTSEKLQVLKAFDGHKTLHRTVMQVMRESCYVARLAYVYKYVEPVKYSRHRTVWITGKQPAWLWPTIATLADDNKAVARYAHLDLLVDQAIERRKIKLMAPVEDGTNASTNIAD